MELIAIDPGETTGWARLLDGSPVDMGELPKYEFFAWLSEERPQQFLYENYIIAPNNNKAARGAANLWSKGEALRIIGAVQYHAYQYAIPIDHQERSILTPACKMFDLPYPKQGVPLRNAIAAMLHARFWWMRHGNKPVTRV